MKLAIIHPPEGAARSLSWELSKCWQTFLGAGEVLELDSKTSIEGFGKILKKEYQDLDFDLWIQNVLAKVIENQVECVFLPALAPANPYLLKLLGQIGVKRAHWFFEDFRRATYWTHWKGLVDWEWGVQEHAPTEMSFLPNACWGNKVNLPTTFTFEYGFVGIPSPYRVQAIEVLAKKGQRVGVWGPGWEKVQIPNVTFFPTWVDFEAELEVYQKCKFNLNLSFTEPGDERRFHQISPRVLRILQSGTSLLTERLPQGNYLWQNVVVSFFDSLADLEVSPQETPFLTRMKNQEWVMHSHHLNARVALMASEIWSKP